MSDEILTVVRRNVQTKTIVLCGEWSLRWAHVNFRINEITLLQKIYCSNQSIGESHIYCAQFSLKTCNSSVVELSPTFFFVFVLPKWSLSRTYVLSRTTNNSVCSSMYTVDHKGELKRYFESLVFTCIFVIIDSGQGKIFPRRSTIRPFSWCDLWLLSFSISRCIWRPH